MATIYSTQSGNWDNPAIWNLGISPTATDDITVSPEHTVTVDSAQVLENALTISGTLVLNANLQTGVNVNVATRMCTVTANPGAEIIINSGAAWHTAHGVYRLKGTADNWVKVFGNGALTYPTANAFRIGWDCEYCSFTNTGEQRIHIGRDGQYDGNTSITSRVIAKNCVFKSDQQYLYIGAGGYTGQTASMEFTNCDFRGKATIRLGRTAPGTGAIKFTQCTFGQIDTKAGINNVSGGVAELIDCVCINSGPGTGPGASNVPYIIQGGFFAESTESTPKVIHASIAGSSITGAYIHNANRPPSNNNPHSVTCDNVRNCIIEMFGSEPNAFSVSSTSLAPTDVFTVADTILIGNGDLANCAIKFIGETYVTGNTVVSYSSGSVGGTYMLENGTSANPVHLRNNLQVSVADKPLYSMARNVTGVGVVLVVDSDHNCIWNTNAFIGKDSVPYSDFTDAHSLRADPGFVDSTRMLEPWVRQHTNNPEATWETAYSTLLGMNGFNEVTNTQIPTNTSHGITNNLYSWVKDGYVPTNPMLATAGQGGTYIGAVAPSATAEEFVDSGTVYTSGMPYGSSPSLAARTATITIPNGWRISSVSVPPVNGRIETISTSVVQYILDNPDNVQDSFVLHISADGGRIGLLRVSINIVQESAKLVVPNSLMLEGESVDNFPVTFNAFANRPGQLTFTVGDSDAIVPGQVFFTEGIQGLLEPALPYTISGPGAGGGIFTVSISPKFPELMFCSCDMGGTYRSTDGGSSWRLIHRFTGMHIGPGAIFCNDGKDTIVWAAKGVSGGTDYVAVSHDTGVTWDKTTRLPIQSLTATDGVVYNSPMCAVAFSTGCVIGSRLDGLIYFDPNTKTFTTIDNNMEKTANGAPRGVWFVDVDGNTIYYTSSKELRKIVYSGGVFGAPQTIYTATDYIVGYAYGNGHHYMTIKNSGVYKSDDAVSWTLIKDFHWQTWIYPAENGALYAAPAKHTALYAPDVFNHTDATMEAVPIWKSLDNGATWESIFDISPSGNVERTWIQTSLGWSYYFMLNGFSVVSGESADKDIIFASSQGEIFRTDNGGKSWAAPYRIALPIIGSEIDRSQSIGLEVTSCWGLKEDIHNPDIWYGLWTDISGQVSFDAGKSWSPANKGVPENHRNTLYGVAQDPEVPKLVWGAFSGVHDIPYDGFVSGVSGNGGIFVSTDNGLSWSKPYTPGTTGPSSQVCTDVIYDHTTNTLYATIYGQAYSDTYPDPNMAASYTNAGVWKSTDRGANWTRIAEGLDTDLTGNLHMYRLAIGPEGGVYSLKTHYKSNNSPGGIFKKNQDDTWTLLGPTGPSGSSWNLWPTSFIFGKTENEIYVTAVNRYPTDKGLMYTANGGQTWESMWSMDVPGVYDYMMSVYADGDFLLLGGANTGPWLSWDHGKNWYVWKDFPFLNIQNVTKIKDRRLACTTFGAGIFIFGQPQFHGHELGYSQGTLKLQSTGIASRDIPAVFTLSSGNNEIATISSVIVVDKDVVPPSPEEEDLSTIAAKLIHISETMRLIAASIVSRGVDVPRGTPPRKFPDKILDIS